VSGSLQLAQGADNMLAIMTRSKTKNSPNEYTSVPFPLKAFKLLLKDVQHQDSGSKKGKGKALDLEIEEDDGVSRHLPK
jgi:hypothetical protein